MCGIAGIVGGRGPGEDAKIAIRRMIALQRHRGPDGEGYYDGIGASLGHCRLAILDLSEAGHQPMSDASSRYWITFNGEIYNYLELAEELRALGHRFRGHSDTEVLLAAFAQWGEACLERLRGMFAFAVWDAEERRLFAARDRLGIKPFHYCRVGEDTFAFASELKALVALLPDCRPNVRLAREYLAWNLLDHDAEETFIEGIRRLPPAHRLFWRRGEGLKLRRYWSLEVSEALDTPSERRGELTTEFRRRFEETVSLHLRSDVPVGTCLSGGLDSSSIVCVVRRELERRNVWTPEWQHTFSACFEERRLDERPFIEIVAGATGCRTHYVFPNGEALAEDLGRWLWHQEEPVGSTGVYAQFCVARLARSCGIKVVLDGQGSDELLAGYRKFILVHLRHLAASRRFGRALAEGMAFLMSPDILRTSQWAAGRRYLFGPGPDGKLLWPNGSHPQAPPSFGLDASLGRRIAADLTEFSLPVLLRYEDRNTMAFGVESRVPFVDHSFVEWAATLAADMRLRNGWTKRILRDALVGVLPEPVRRRKSKLGFDTPQSAWLAGPLADWLHEALSASRHLEGLVDREGIRQLLARRAAGDRGVGLEDQLFRLATYESWARQLIERATPPENEVLPRHAS